IDLIPYVTMLSILLLYIGKRIPHLFIIRYFSKYAFGIYLLHWLIQQIIAPYFAEFNNVFLQVSSLFFVSLIISIITIYLIIFIIDNINPQSSLFNNIIDNLKLIFKNKTHSKL